MKDFLPSFGAYCAAAALFVAGFAIAALIDTHGISNFLAGAALTLCSVIAFMIVAKVLDVIFPSLKNPSRIEHGDYY